MEWESEKQRRKTAYSGKRGGWDGVLSLCCRSYYGMWRESSHAAPKKTDHSECIMGVRGQRLSSFLRRDGWEQGINKRSTAGLCFDGGGETVIADGSLTMGMGSLCVCGRGCWTGGSRGRALVLADPTVRMRGRHRLSEMSRQTTGSQGGGWGLGTCFRVGGTQVGSEHGVDDEGQQDWPADVISEGSWPSPHSRASPHGAHACSWTCADRV